MVGSGIYGYQSILARVSIVNSNEECVYDTFVKPMLKITDYRTKYSGVTIESLKNAPTFKEVQLKVYEMTKGRILVGHDIKNDLKALLLTHPKYLIRDTSTFKPLVKLRGIKPSLKFLAQKLLTKSIQSGEHSSIEDARATMQIFKIIKSDWEKSLRCKDKKTEIYREIYENLQKR